MSKLLYNFVNFVQITSGPRFLRFLRTANAKRISLIMSKRSNFHRTPKFKPEVVRVVTNRSANIFETNKRSTVEVLSQPIKSVSDSKNYKVIRLENGLTALLISDPSRNVVDDDDTTSDEDTGTDESSTERETNSSKSGHTGVSDKRRHREFNDEKLAACALSVNVGSYSDPADIQGLAHFVEHMVFMGSEKFPKENEFDSFVKKKGGADNASTDCEITTFYFEIPEKHLLHGMDMFSNFFVSPLMKKEAMQREREAIESEFAIATPSDSNRRDQLLASFFPEGHPARTFTWGNLKSLKDDIDDDEKLYQAAHEFRKRHYSAHRMTVAVQGRVDIPVLEQYVINTFGRIPSNNLPPDDFSSYAFSNDTVTPAFASIYYVKPVSDTTEVILTWCMRSLISEYESKPHQYISYLLGHEGKGSLLSYLRKKVWALGIYTGNSESGIDYTSMYSLFSTQVVLTKKGLDHVDEVLEAIFSYLNMLREIGPSKRIFEEIKIIEETSFRFEQESQPADYVENLVENMHLYPPNHYITGDRLYYKYNPKAVTQLLDMMQPDNVNIMIVSKKHSKPVQYDEKEKWFGTEYKRIDTPQDWMDRWLKVEPYSQFHLPSENVYLTKNFKIIEPDPVYKSVAAKIGVDLRNSSSNDIHKRTEEHGGVEQVLRKDELMTTVKKFRLDQPNVLRQNKHMEVWYKPDFKFRFPTALLYFYFITPLGLKSPREACLLDLWTDVLQQGLKEEVYPANMADLSHEVFVSDTGVAVKLSGYSENLHLLMELITQQMRNNSDNMDVAMFEAVRDVRTRSYHNILIKPHKLAKDIRMNILLEPYIGPRDKAAVIEKITLNDLKAFHNEFISKMYLQMLVQGNLPWHRALEIADRVMATLNFDAVPEAEIPDVKVHQLPLGERRVRVMSFNRGNTNSIVANYYQGDVSNLKDNAILEIIMMLMEEPVFDMLRTKEQLGYSVFSMMRYTFGVLGFTITVNTQADKFSVYHVDKRIEAFLKIFARSMKRLGERSLQATKTALVQLKHTADFELKEEVERHWREIIMKEYKFQRQFQEADAIAKVKLSELKAWVEDHSPSAKSTSFRKLSIQVMGYKDKETNTTTTADKQELRSHELTYLDAKTKLDDETENADEFILNLDEFKRTLPLFKVDKQLSQC